MLQRQCGRQQHRLLVGGAARQLAGLHPLPATGAAVNAFCVLKHSGYCIDSLLTAWSGKSVVILATLCGGTACVSDWVLLVCHSLVVSHSLTVQHSPNNI